MADNEALPQSGLVVAGDDDPSDKISEFTYPILDDIFYNIIHDLCLKTHRDEKIARANSAAIIIDQKAKATDPNTYEDDDDPINAVQIPHIVETDGAKYVNREVFIKGNPLKTTPEILCPKCFKPRLLHPTDGIGAKKPEAGVDYCKKPYFIEKEYFDIYGQIFQQEGPGRGKKKKDMINPLLLQSAKEDTPSGSQDSTPPPNKEIISFPSQKCLNCGTHILIRRMNNHMVKCIGGGGRDSSRSALLKIQNGNGNGTSSQNGTPPGSRNGTPAPAANGKRSSPNKRSPGDDFESDTPPKKKKIIKKTAATKLKAPKMMKSASQHSTSNLSFESKAPASDYEDGDNDDDGDGEYGTVVVEPKKKAPSIVKKMKDVAAKKKWKISKGAKPALPPVEFPGVAKLIQKKNGKLEDEVNSESPESSQTLSSPN